MNRTADDCPITQLLLTSHGAYSKKARRIAVFCFVNDDQRHSLIIGALPNCGTHATNIGREFAEFLVK
jgi:hypothetical protein